MSVTVFVEKSHVPVWVRGVGILVPERESEREVLGILMTSSPFPGRVIDEDRIASFTVILGGTSRPEALGWSDGRIQETIVREFRAILGIEHGIVAFHIHRWKAAIPVYGSALTQAWERLRSGFCSRPGRIVFGNYAGEVSLRGMIETSKALGVTPEKP